MSTRKKIRNKIKNVKTRIRSGNLSPVQQRKAENKITRLKERRADLPNGGGGNRGDGYIKAGIPASSRGAEKLLNAGVGLSKTLLPEAYNPDGTPNEGYLGRINVDPSRQAGVDSNLADLTQRSREVSPDLQAIIDQRKAEQGGFNTAEEEALKLNAQQQIQGQLGAGLRAAQALNAGRGLRGGAAAKNFAPALTAALQQQRGLAADIFTKQIDERARRLAELQGAIERRDQNLFTNQLQANQLQSGNVLQSNQLEQELQRTNLDQRAKELASRVSAVGAGTGLVGQERDRRQQQNQFQSALDQQEEDYNQLFSNF